MGHQLLALVVTRAVFALVEVFLIIEQRGQRDFSLGVRKLEIIVNHFVNTRIRLQFVQRIRKQIRGRGSALVLQFFGGRFYVLIYFIFTHF